MAVRRAAERAREALRYRLVLPRPAARAAILLVAGGLAAAAVHRTADLSRQREELVATAVELAIDERALLRRLERAEDPESARAELAGAALAAALDPSGPGAALRERRLDAAERLAREALARRPASWQAAMVAGAAPYLRWSLAGDPRLVQEYRRWEEPLALAVRLAPGQGEPVRFLATAYLDLWPSLSDEKRERAEELLARAFEDPSAFRQLLGPWLDVSGGDLGPIPDTPWAWTTLQETLAERREWSRYCRAWTTRRRALLDRLSEDVARGERLVDTGRLLAGRTALFQAAAAAPVDRDFAPLVDRALTAAPYGPGRSELASPFAAWLEWALGLDLLDSSKAPPPLSPEALARLRAVVTAGSAEPRHRAAAVWTYLAAGEWRDAERAERQSGSRWSEPWAPYWIVKARRQVERGELAEARRALAEVHPLWQDHPAFRRVRRALAAAEGTPGVSRFEDDAAAAEAARVWTWDGTRARLEPWLGAAAGGLEVRLAEVPPGGAAVALRWDGEVTGCHAAAEPRTIALDRAVEPGLHLLEVETLGSGAGRVAPGPVRWLAPGS